LGGHGKRRDPSIERSHVRRMARQFGVLECFQREIEGL